MLKFFRHIQKNLLNQGKKTNYLKYAIGEIALVVIGILIALAVAEWNSNRRDIKTEHRLLTELKQGITKDLATIEDELEWTKSSINNLIKLDSLLKLNKAIYEDLKSVGFGIIHNEKLRT